MAEQIKVLCPECESVMRLRNGKYGKFYGCSAYPKCKSTLSLDQAKEQVAEKKSNGKQPAKNADWQPSTYQLDVFDFITNGKGNAVVEAVAGSGKTTTIVKALELTPKGQSVLFCAFNKHIQRELASRAPSHVKVSTIHSIGFNALKEALPHKPQVDDGKLWGIIKEVLPLYEDYPLHAPLAKLVGLCKRTLVNPNNPLDIEEVAEHHDIELNGDAERLIALVPVVMGMCRERLTVIDFDDMIWLPIELNITFRTFTWVFVDECQDLSPAQLEIVKRSVAKVGRVIAVGDRRQSIYGFVGADTNAVPRMIEELNATVLPLSITYRCPISVVNKAKTIVPQIEAASWAEEGEVDEASYDAMMRELEDGDLILCRVNAPLVKACYSLIRRGEKAIIRGRDIGQGLINFIDRLKPTDIYDLMTKVRDYKYEQTKKLEAAGKEAQIESLHDRCDTLVELCDGMANLTELRAHISNIFDDVTKDGIILSSIHRAKGDEAEVVWLLRPELLPHPLATKDWQQEQERNLEYVAYTRSKDTLIFVR